jgi:GNAT superfamily N-acetyltransferase
MVVPVPGVTFQLLDGRAVASRGDEDLLALHAESCAGDAMEYARQFRVWRRQPGFALAAAMHGGFLVGYAAGVPLRPSTSWWKNLTSPLADSMTDEYPGRTFAVTALLVRAAWRRQGIGATLHALLLAGRPEERATLTVPVAAGPAQRAMRALGWAKAARTRTQDGVEDVFLLSPLQNGPPPVAQ